MRHVRGWIGFAVVAACGNGTPPEENAAPEINLTSPGDGEVVNEGGTVSLAAEVLDDHDALSALSLVWESDLDGALGTEASLTTDALSVGTHEITLTAEDTAGLASSASVTLRINGLPGAPVVSLPTVNTTEDLAVAIDTESVDPEGDTVEYTYVWSLDGVAQEGQTDSSVPASDTEKGDVWRVEVTPSDGRGQGPSATATTTIANTAPVVSSVTLPAAAFTDDVLTAVVEATDADGDPLTFAYTWTVDAVDVAVDSATLDGADHFDKGQTVTVTVIASDGEGPSDAATSNSTTILNSPPIPPAVVITPADPVAGIDDLVCTIDTPAMDPDGDNVSYAFTWYEDEVEFAGTAMTTTWADDTIAADDTTDGIPWECEVVASDDDDPPAAAAPVTDSTTPAGCIVTVRWEVDGALVHTVDVPEVADYPTTTWIMLQIWGNQQFVSADGQIDNLLATSLADGSVLLSDDFSSGGAWTTSGGAIGSTSVTGGVADGQSDWNEFRQLEDGLPMDGGVRVELDARVSSATLRVGVALETDTTGEDAGNDYVHARSQANDTAGFRVLPDNESDVVSSDWITLEDWHTLALEVDPSPSCTAVQ